MYGLDKYIVAVCFKVRKKWFLFRYYEREYAQFVTTACSPSVAANSVACMLELEIRRMGIPGTGEILYAHRI